MFSGRHSSKLVFCFLIAACVGVEYSQGQQQNGSSRINRQNTTSAKSLQKSEGTPSSPNSSGLSQAAKPRSAGFRAVIQPAVRPLERPAKNETRSAPPVVESRSLRNETVARERSQPFVGRKTKPAVVLQEVELNEPASVEMIPPELPQLDEAVALVRMLEDRESVLVKDPSELSFQDDQEPQKPKKELELPADLQQIFSFGKWPRMTIEDISLDIRETAEMLPKSYSQELMDYTDNSWKEFAPTHKMFAWAAPDIRYQPLYFEDVALERYGQTYFGVRQFTRSAIHFTKSTLLLPYHMRFNPPQSCDYPLGYSRPGNCVEPVCEHQWWGTYLKHRYK